MSQENVEITGRAYDYFIANGDFLAEVFNPDFVWDMSTFRGGVERLRMQGSRAQQFDAALHWAQMGTNRDFEPFPTRSVDSAGVEDPA